MSLLKKFISGFFVLGFSIVPFFVMAEDIINLEGPDLLPKTELFITPRSGDFLVGSTFEVPVYLDTKGHNINAVSLKIRFDPNKLAITKPSSGKSIFGIWIETPNYDNTKGTASLVGVIPDGIVTSSGLIGIITFKAIASGTTTISISDYTSANLNDGFGSEAKLSLRGATYTLSPKPSDGMIITSETHPSQDTWYNNNSPILSWQGSANDGGYSITLDNNPNTIPANEINTKESSKSYENVRDGIWYFHAKAISKGLWGNTSHFKIKIDTNIPAQFNPSASVIENSGNAKKYLLSFLTTDSLSGLDHYEVGTIDKKDVATISPVFVETESPYLIPFELKDDVKVLVRAYDNAGNIREASVDLYPGYNLLSLIKKYAIYILFFFLVFMFLELLFHYLFGHHILSHFKRAYLYFKRMAIKDKLDSEEADKIPLPPIYERDESETEINRNSEYINKLKQHAVLTINPTAPQKFEKEETPHEIITINENPPKKEEYFVVNKVEEKTPLPLVDIDALQKIENDKKIITLKEKEKEIKGEDEVYKSLMEKFINPKLIPIDLTIKNKENMEDSVPKPPRL